MKLSITLFFTFFAFDIYADCNSYSTHCRINDGKAEGWVIVDTFCQIEYDGTVVFTVYDEDFGIIDHDSGWDWHWHYGGEDLADEISVPDDAVSCAFDISRANPDVSS